MSERGSDEKIFGMIFSLRGSGRKVNGE
jgi:hypothetical protein